MLLNFLSVIIFSLDASLNASAKRKTVLSTVFISLITTFGGGAIIRDIIILHQIPGCLNAPLDIILCVTVSILVYLGCSLNLQKILYLNPISKIRYLLDKLGTATFIVMGLTKGMSYNLSFIFIIICGVAPGVGGGTIAKMLYEAPCYALKVRKKEIICAFIISFFTYPIAACSGNETISIILSFIVTLIVFYLANNIKQIKYNLKSTHEYLISSIFVKTIPLTDLVITIVSRHYQDKAKISKSILRKITKASCYSSRYGKYRYIVA